MAALLFPCTIFKTKKWMNDYKFHFFRIWFMLQRYNLFSFRPFMTNMEATVEITGERNERKK